MKDRVGQQLGNYQLLRVLGRGDFAEVYLGEHVRLHTYAAIKVLRSHLQEGDAEVFLAEAQTIARLDHPHIIRLLDFDIAEGVPFLVMSYAPGGTLRSRHRKGSYVPPALVVSYVKEIAEALQYAHDERVIHRDVKPENMLVGTRGEVILSDFGIATLARSSYSVHTHNVAGTIAYMAPEQIQAHPRPASDQYALAVAAYEWLCGVRPFEGTYYEVVSKHLTVAPQPLHHSNPLLPPEIEQVLLTALAKDPKQRFRSICTFALELERASKSETSFIQGIPLGTPYFDAATLPSTSASDDQSNDLDASVAMKSSREYAYGFEPSWPSAFPQDEPVAPTPQPITSRSVSVRGRRHTLALLAGVGSLVLGATLVASMHPWKQSTNLASSYTSQTPSGNRPVQGTMTTSTPMGTPPPSQNERHVIGSTHVALNSAVDFIDPKDQQGSLLVHLPDGHFVAYDNSCTHEGVAVHYDPVTPLIVCPAHGAIFDPARGGSVIEGPARTQLSLVTIQVHADGTITAE